MPGRDEPGRLEDQLGDLSPRILVVNEDSFDKKGLNKPAGANPLEDDSGRLSPVQGGDDEDPRTSRGTGIKPKRG